MSPRPLGFPLRNGFARRSDLEHPKLRPLVELCRRESEDFEGRASLGWSRQWEYPYALANLSENGDGQRLLEAGSGYRFFSRLLARRGYRVHACDLDASVGAKLERLGVPGDRLEFSVEDLEATSFPDQSFDAITCISVLEHTGAPERVLDEFWRCLRPGGALIVTFDVSLQGDRDVDLAQARRLVEQGEARFEPQSAFQDFGLLEDHAIREACDRDEILHTGWFREWQPELLPWRRLSRAGLQGLLRGRLGRPFFELAVIGLTLKRA